MIPGMGDLSNSGSMPITGGAATNGDQKNQSSSSVGGFGSNRFGRVSNGINPTILIVGAVAVAAIFLLRR